MADGKIEIDVILNDGSLAKGIANLDDLERSSEKAGVGIGSMVKAMGLVKLASGAFNVMKSSMDGAISRFDTMQKFPKVMSALGFSAEDSQKSIGKLSDGIDGLPTKLDDVVSSTQRMTSITNDLDKSTDATIALNNAFLASGASTDGAARGMDQYMKILSTGKVELDSWSTLQETMPLALQKTAEAFKFTGKSAQNDLYAALKSGKISIDEFQDKLIELGTGTGMLANLAKENSLGIATSIGNLKNSVAKNLGNMLTKFDEIIQKTSGKTIAKNIDGLKVLINNTFGAIIKSMDNIIPMIEKITTFVKDNATAFKILGGVVVAVAGGFVAFKATIGIMNSVKGAITGVKTAFTAMKFAMMANPFALVIAGVAALVAALVYFYKTSETFRSKVDNMVKSLSDFLAPLKNVGEGIKLFGELLSHVLSGTYIAGYLDEMRDKFSKLFPESVFNQLLRFSQFLLGIKVVIGSFIGILNGSIKSITDLEDATGGVIKEETIRRMMSIGKATKDVITYFKNLLNPTKSAGKSIDIFGIAMKILKGVFLSLLGPIGLAIKAFELIAKALGGGDIKKGVSTIMDSFSGLAKGIKDNSKQAGASVGDLIEGILKAIANALPGIIKGGLAIVTGLIKGLAEGIIPLTLAAGELIRNFIVGLVIAIPQIVLAAGMLITTFIMSLTAVMPQIIAAGLELLLSLIIGITQGLPQIVTAVATMITTFLDSLTENIGQIIESGVNLLVAWLQGITDNLDKIIATVSNLITTFLTEVANHLPELITSGANLIIAWLQGIADNLGGVIEAAVNVIVAFLQGIANNLPKVVSAAVDVIVAFVRSVGNNLDKIVRAAWDLVDKMVQTIVTSADRMAKAAIALLNGLADSLDKNRDAVHRAITRLLESMVRMFVPDILWNAGAAIIDGFVGGLKSAWEKGKEFIGGIGNWIKEHKGPISYDKKLLIPAGKSIMTGFKGGLQKGFKNVQALVNSMADKVQFGFETNLNSSQFVPVLPKITAESALNIGGRMSTGTNTLNNYYTTNNGGSQSDNSEVVGLLKKLVNKDTVLVVKEDVLAKVVDRRQANNLALRNYQVE